LHPLNIATHTNRVTLDTGRKVFLPKLRAPASDLQSPNDLIQLPFFCAVSSASARSMRSIEISFGLA